jgi:hypothetical protein
LILQNYFRKLSFFENSIVKKILLYKKFMQCYTFFGCSGLETLAGVATGWGGGGAGSSYELDAARSIQSMFLFLILDLLGGFSLKA